MAINNNICREEPQIEVDFHQLCHEHDLSLPGYPLPELDSVLQAILDRSSIRDHEDNERLGHAVALFREQHAQTFYTVVLSLKPTKNSNWVTTRYVQKLLGVRAPLSYTSFTGSLQSSSLNNVITASSLLHAVALTYASADALKQIGTDGKSKKFETKQLSQAFSTIRQPGVHVDTLKTHQNSRHVVVWSKGIPFAVDILDSDRQAVQLEGIFTDIQHILEVTTDSGNSNASIAALSTHLPRHLWAEQRSVLMNVSSSSMHILESAITSIALHDEKPTTFQEWFALAKRCSKSVYSDKTLGFSVFPDGGCAFRAEHAALDGGVVCRIVHHVRETMRSLPQSFGSSGRPSRARRISFGRDCTRPMPALGAANSLQTATRVHHVTVDRHALDLLRYSKCFNFVMQLAYQSALHHISPSEIIPVNEPTAVRIFSEGRCDPNFVSTAESIAFCQLLADGAPNDELQRVFKSAEEKYRSLLQQTRNGLAVGPSCSVLEHCAATMPESPEKNALLTSLKYLQSRPAYFAGASLAPHVTAVEPFVFLPNQIALTYLGHSDEVVVCLTGSGKYIQNLEEVETAVERNFRGIMAVALSSIDLHQPKVGFWSTSLITVLIAAIVGRTRAIELGAWVWKLFTSRAMQRNLIRPNAGMGR